MTIHMRVALPAAATALAWAASSSGDPGSCDMHWRRGLDALIGANGLVTSMRVVDLGDGPMLVVGGTFPSLGDAASQGVIAFDGERWRPLGSGLGGEFSPYSFAQVSVQHDDGAGPTLVVGGLFTIAGGVDANYIARWDGTSWSPIGAGFDKQVRALAVGDLGAGNRLFAGGLFTTSGSTAVSHIAEWDGRAWNPLGAGIDANVYCATVADLGDGPALYVGGNFDSAGGSAAWNIAKWTGTAWSALGGGIQGANSTVSAMTVWDDGRGPALYIGGHFTAVGDIEALHVARWDGTGWSAVGAGVNGDVNALTIFDDGTGAALIAGGSIEHDPGQWPWDIVRFDGDTWAPMGDGQSASTTALTVFPNDGTGTLYAGGLFRAADSAAVDRIARWGGAKGRDGGGGSWSPIDVPTMGFSTNDRVFAALARDTASGPEILIGGTFGKVDGISAPCVARWNADGWQQVGQELAGFALDLIEFDDGTGPAVYAGGTFPMGADGSYSGVLKLVDGAWVSLNSALTGSNRQVRDLCVFDDGTGPQLYACGIFSSIGGVPAKHIARWDGTAWHALLTGLDGSGWALHVHNDGGGPALLVGGQFAHAGGVAATGVARWDGAAWSTVGAGPSKLSVFGMGATAFSTFDDGAGDALYVAGVSMYAGGDGPFHGVLRWDGASWSQVGDDMDVWIRSLIVHDDGDGPALIAGGGGAEFDSLPPFGLLKRWDGRAWQDLGGGVGAVVDSFFGGVIDLASLPGGGLFVVGAFGTAVEDDGGGIVARSMALWDRRDSAWIVGQPRDVIVRAGEAIALAVQVVVEPAAPSPTFQWRRNGEPLVDGDGVVGATSEALLIADAGAGNAGDYDVVVTDACGDTLSRSATVVVTCSADVNVDGIVDGADLALILGGWGTANIGADLDGSGVVDGADLAEVLAAWGACGRV